MTRDHPAAAGPGPDGIPVASPAPDGIPAVGSEADGHPTATGHRDGHPTAPGHREGPPERAGHRDAGVPPAEPTRPARSAPATRVESGLDLAGWMAALRGLLARPLASYYLLLSSSGLLLVIGLTMVFSATSVKAYAEDGNVFAELSKQAVFALVGLAAFWACQRLPARTFRAIGPLVLGAALVLLLVLDALLMWQAVQELPVAKVGPVEADLLWLYVGPLQLQPSELAKFGLVLWGAGVIVRKGEALGWWRELATPLLPAVGVLFLLVGYNDLGTMLCLLAIVVGLLWAAGVRLRVFAALSALGLAGIGLLVAAASTGSAADGGNFRLRRLTSFFNPAPPEDCKLLDCYQLLQARYAIHNGGWFGVGLGESKLKWAWLPAADNDFIFAVVAEELGVMGCAVVLALFAVLTYTGFRIARRVHDPFRRLAAAAVTTWLVSQAVINIGGVIGLLPITGLPLPFISDGGSALVVTLAAVGMLASFARAEPDAARALHARPPARWVRLLWAPLPPLPAAPRGGTPAVGSTGPAVRRSPGGSSATTVPRPADRPNRRRSAEPAPTRGGTGRGRAGAARERRR